MPVSNNKLQGFSLLELLIALIVFSIGLLAIAGLQTVSKQANYEAIQRTTAAQVANGLLEDMRTNGNGIDVYSAAPQLGGGVIGAEPVPNCRDGSECNAAQKAAHDLWFWEQVLDGNLETNAGIAAGGLVLPELAGKLELKAFYAEIGALEGAAGRLLVQPRGLLRHRPWWTGE